MKQKGTRIAVQSSGLHYQVGSTTTLWGALFDEKT
jgi:hypothetical protein